MSLTGAVYRDRSVPIPIRVGDLLGHMTLEEKLAQLSGCSVFDLMAGGSDIPLSDLEFSETRAREVMGRGIGLVSRLTVLDRLPGEMAGIANRIQRFLVEETRLGIPAMLPENITGGLQGRRATCFPYGLALAATFDPDLAEAMASEAARQARAIGINQALSPSLDITRDARWGRTEENFGEDPYLSARMGVAYTRGLMGPDLRTGVLATGKHFVGHGSPEGGLNSARANIGPRELREVHLVPFEAAIREAGLPAIMSAYHEIDGVPSVSRAILTDLLRGEAGFQGFVISDNTGVWVLRAYHAQTADDLESAVTAIEAGCDVEFPVPATFRLLADAVASKRVSVSTIDRAVANHLRAKFALGLFDNPYADPDQAEAVYASAAGRQLARRIAERSIVLLKNDGILPLAEGGSLALIGPNAASVRRMLGFYHYPGIVEAVLSIRMDGARPRKVEFDPDGPDARGYRMDVPVVTLLEALTGRVGELLFQEGCGEQGADTSGFGPAVDAARRADLAILALGDSSGMAIGFSSGETHDRATLGLPGVQEALAHAVIDTGVPTVLVLINSRPAAIPEVVARAGAVLECWLPGEQGGHAIADVLFGIVNPGGKLPISIPRSVGQVPVYYNHKPSSQRDGPMSDFFGDYLDLPATPLFAFGHGLSYTSFGITDLAITPEEGNIDAPIEVAVTVTNTGDRTGDETVQLYIRDVAAAVTRPVKELKGFARLELKPGGRARVHFKVHPGQLGFHDAALRHVVEPGTFDVLVGSASDAIQQRGQFRLLGTSAEAIDKVFRSEVQIAALD
jgi:beta-glucosidase